MASESKTVLVVALVPPEVLVYQPLKVYPSRVGVGREESLPLVLVVP